MPAGKRRIDRVLAQDYLEGLESKPLALLREMRQDASEEEALVSYERRLLHGRLAILRAELERRAGGGEGSLIDRLPAILGGEGGPASSRGAFPGDDPKLDFEVPQRRVTKLVSDDTLLNLETLEDGEIGRIAGELEEAERDVSDQRKPLLAVLDRLNAELTRRYRSGEADPSDLLSQR